MTYNFNILVQLFCPLSHIDVIFTCSKVRVCYRMLLASKCECSNTKQNTPRNFSQFSELGFVDKPIWVPNTVLYVFIRYKSGIPDHPLHLYMISRSWSPFIAIPRYVLHFEFFTLLRAILSWVHSIISASDFQAHLVSQHRLHHFVLMLNQCVLSYFQCSIQLPCMLHHSIVLRPRKCLDSLVFRGDMKSLARLKLLRLQLTSDAA